MPIDRDPSAAKQAVGGSRRASLEVDIQCAAVSKGGVLITGPSAEAETIAREIHRRGQANLRPFEVVDCGDPDCLRALDGSNEPVGGTLLLRDVDLLSPALQEHLLARIADRRLRIIASCRECPREKLAPVLFYQLNIVYITLDSAR